MQSKGLQAVDRIRRQLPGPCVTLTGTFSISLFSLCFLQLEFHNFSSWINPGLRLGSPATNFLALDISAVTGCDSARSHEQARPGKGPLCLPHRLGLLNFTQQVSETLHERVRHSNRELSELAVTPMSDREA
jgi:hypothetical protein